MPFRIRNFLGIRLSEIFLSIDSLGSVKQAINLAQRRGEKISIPAMRGNEPIRKKLWIDSSKVLTIVGVSRAAARTPKNPPMRTIRNVNSRWARAAGFPTRIVSSTIFPRRGAWNILLSRETSRVLVTNDIEMAICFDLSPAYRIE